MSPEESLNQLRIECDNYNLTVMALKTLAHELLWNDSTNAIDQYRRAFFGRRLDKLTGDSSNKERTVTPDLLVQVDAVHGILAEAKASLPKELEYKENVLLRLTKYDADLAGWPNDSGRVADHDLVLLIEYTHAKQAEAIYKRLSKRGDWKPKRNFSILRFAVMQRVEEEMVLELISGKLRNRRKTEKFRNALAIPLERIAENPAFAGMQLYDAEPPMPLLMAMIHELFVGRLERNEYIELLENGVVRKTYSVDKLRKELEEQCGPSHKGERVPQVPKKDWVRKAIKNFAAMKWVELDEKSRDQFVYIVKKRRNFLDAFLKHCAKVRVLEERAKQRNLVDKKGQYFLFPRDYSNTRREEE